MRHLFAILLFALVHLCWHPIVHAGNDRSYFLGNEAALTAGAGVAVTRDSEAVWYNPAGLGGLRNGKLELSGSAFVLRVRTVPDMFVTDLHSGQHRFSPTAHQFLAAPAAFTLVRRGTRSLGWGFGIYVSSGDIFSMRHNYRGPDTIPGWDAATYLQGLSIHNQAYLYRLGPSLGWQIVPRLRIGGGIFFVYLNLRDGVQYFGQVDGTVQGDAVNTHYSAGYQLSANLVGVMGVFGLQWEFVRNFHMGLTIRTPTITGYRWGKGTQTVSYAQLDTNMNIVTALSFESEKLDGWVFSMIEPANFTFALGYRGRTWWVGTEATLMLGINDAGSLFHRKLNFNVSVGGKFKISRKVSGGAGFFTDRSPRPHPDEVAERDIDFYGLTLGIEYRSRFTVDRKSGPRTMTFATVLGLRYAAGIGQVGGLRYDFAGSGNLLVQPREVTFHEIAVHIGSALFF